MRSFYARGFILAMGALGVLADGHRLFAQYPGYGAPSTLPQQAAPATPPNGYPGYNYPSTNYPPAAGGYQTNGGQPNGYQSSGYQAPPANYQPASYSNNRYATNPNFYSVAARNGDPESIATPNPVAQGGMMPQSSPPIGTGTSGPIQSPYMSAMQSSPWDTGSGCSNGSCGGGAMGGASCGGGCWIPSFPQPCGYWYGGIGGMVLGRDHSNNRWLSGNNDFPTDHYLTTNDAATKVGGGPLVTFGRYFNCGWNAIEATYWGVNPGTNCASVYDSNTTNGLYSNLQFNDPSCGCGLYYTDGNGNTAKVQDAFDGAKVHKLSEHDEFQNFEVNVLGFGIGGFGGGCGGGGFGGGGGGGYGGGSCGSGSCGSGSCGSGSCGCGCSSWGPGGPGFCCNGCNRVRFAWLGGVRYFRFTNNLDYGTNNFAPTFTGSPDELHYRINVVNNLVGYQVGGRFDYCLGRCVSAYAVTKVGLYANNMNQHQCISNSSGYAYVNDTGNPYNGQAFNVATNSTRASLLAEIDLGLLYRFTRCWSANIGVKAIGLSGTALAPNQFPTDFADLSQLHHINSNGNLLLTGAYASLNYNW